MQVECQQKDGFNRAQIFGNGVGIWNGKRQFELEKQQVQAMLEALDQASFARMPVVFQDAPANQGPVSTARGVRCQIQLELDATAKRAAQLPGQSASEKFLQLAVRLLEISRAAGGTTVRHLDEGLESIARGELAAETLHVSSQRKPSRGDSDPQGWLLELNGRVVESRSFTPQDGYGEPMRLELTDEALQALAKRLVELSPRSLPQRLASDAYETLAFELLQYRRRVETARPGGPAPEVERQRRERVARALDVMRDLHLRVVAEGVSTTPNLAR